MFRWYLSVYGLARSHDKLKSIQQLLWLPTHKVKWTFDPLILLEHMTYWNHYTSTTTVPMVTKLGNLMFFPWGATIQMTLRSHGPARPCDELKTYIYYHDTNDLQNEIQWGGEIQWQVPIHKVYGHVKSCDKLKTSTFIMPATLVSVVIYCQELSLINLHDPWMRSHDIK